MSSDGYKVAAVATGCVVSAAIGYLLAVRLHAAKPQTAVLRKTVVQKLEQVQKAMSKQLDTSAAAESIVEVGSPMPKVRRTSHKVLFGQPDTKWLRFASVTFEAAVGDPASRQQHSWEVVERTTSVGGLDGVECISFVHQPDGTVELLLLLNYRPPVDGVCVEFPGGLVDAGETPQQAGVRELQEETGFVGTARAEAPICFVDPWKSTETFKFVVVDIDGSKPENVNPKPHREAEEYMQVLRVRPHLLQATLNYLADTKGYLIEGKLATMATTLSLASSDLFRAPTTAAAVAKTA